LVTLPGPLGGGPLGGGTKARGPHCRPVSACRAPRRPAVNAGETGDPRSPRLLGLAGRRRRSLSRDSSGSVHQLVQTSLESDVSDHPVDNADRLTGCLPLEKNGTFFRIPWIIAVE